MAIKNKLIRKLRRELTANPKKAAVLAILFGIAVWFWLPLLGLHSSNETTPTPTTEPNVTTVTSNSNTSTTSVASDAGKPNNVSWKQVLDWIRNDPLMQPQSTPAGARNPFGPSEAHRLAQEKSVQATQPPALPELTPEQVGLALYSTMVGKRAKTALINERAYHEGQTIVAANGTDKFKLIKIAVSYVVLERDGKQYVLKLPSAEVAGLDE